MSEFFDEITTTALFDELDSIVKEAGMLTPRFMGQAPTKTQKTLQSIAKKFGWKEKPYVKKFAPGSKSLSKADIMGYEAKKKDMLKRVGETHKKLTG